MRDVLYHWHRVARGIGRRAHAWGIPARVLGDQRVRVRARGTCSVHIAPCTRFSGTEGHSDLGNAEFFLQGTQRPHESGQPEDGSGRGARRPRLDRCLVPGLSLPHAGRPCASPRRAVCGPWDPCTAEVCMASPRPRRAQRRTGSELAGLQGSFALSPLLANARGGRGWGGPSRDR